MLPSEGSAVVIVAHPDDETLWAGGIILANPQLEWYIVSLCRKEDPDRAPKFYKVLQELDATGAMANLDDGPEQFPLPIKEVRDTIQNLLPEEHFDLILTHHPKGEYTRHRRHEETAQAVINCWCHGSIQATNLWTFAYEDGHKKYYPQAMENADILFALPEKIREKKYQLITDIYGFDKNSWEAKVTPPVEAFCTFTDKGKALDWLQKNSII
ncbi:LmbE family N-acetylglucosaminyl deacetylase [Chitinophaga dinghuensis]|uniref:LmbE family N-acetylglucosaminyl deacetylase n=1 Tax=Chitinophaga dinghuensis TaxID=1539050 RepID=A0A327VQE5_9BACT|nr:PIG-L family deacetylase [Chitinophaga dinghuensis]RAJ76577.1 LmbE family N-acetylglucosaminyl deacetylase [Chitinophaga dinghuensis]